MDTPGVHNLVIRAAERTLSNLGEKIRRRPTLSIVLCSSVPLPLFLSSMAAWLDLQNQSGGGNSIEMKHHHPSQNTTVCVSVEELNRVLNWKKK